MDKQITALMDEQTKNTLDKLAVSLEDALAPLSGIEELKSRVDHLVKKVDLLQASFNEIKAKLK